MQRYIFQKNSYSLALREAIFFCLTVTFSLTLFCSSHFYRLLCENYTHTTMQKSKVYFTDFRTKAHGAGLPKKLQKLIRKAGIGEIDMDGKFVAIKMHFGELGNISFLRPNYAKAVADMIKAETSLNVSIENLGPVIGCHAGPGTIALFFMSSKR